MKTQTGTTRRKTAATKQAKVKHDKAKSNIADAKKVRQVVRKAKSGAGSDINSTQNLQKAKAKNGHGGARMHAGRPIGSKERREAIVAARRSAEAGSVDPLTYLLSQVADVKLDRPTRMQAAAMALPFLKPRLAAMAVAGPPSQLPSWTWPSVDELRRSVRGDVVEALPAPVQPVDTQTEPVKEEVPPPRLIKRKSAPEPVDKLAPYRDRRIAQGMPLEPLEPDWP